MPLSDQARPRFWFSTWTLSFAALVLSSVAIKGATLVLRMVQSFSLLEIPHHRLEILIFLLATLKATNILLIDPLLFEKRVHTKLPHTYSFQDLNNIWIKNLLPVWSWMVPKNSLSLSHSTNRSSWTSVYVYFLMEL